MPTSRNSCRGGTAAVGMRIEAVARRQVASWIAIALAQVAAPPASRAIPDRRCTTTSNPSITVTVCERPPLSADGSLGGCGAGESCIATAAVKSPSKYSPPWAPPSFSAEATDAGRAFRALVGAIEEQAGLQIQEQDAEQLYVRAIGSSAVPPDGTDDVEFRVRRDSETNRVSVSFRSGTRQSIMVYPITQPLVDDASHYKRLNEIRRRLGWDEMGRLPSGVELEQGEGIRQVRSFLGLNFGGMRVPDEDEY
eukprot:scaffold90508_cov28-Tisochrysis_lutea.AAC.3